MKRVLVTGASKGIGLATVKELVETCFVYGIGRSTSPFQHKQFCYFQGDITKGDFVEFVAKEIQRKGQLHSIVHNAGLNTFNHVDLKEWRHVFDVNFFAVIDQTQKLLPLESIIIVSSGVAKHAYKGMSAYCCSKAAVTMLCECLALEFPRIITVALRPGVVETDMQTSLRAAENALDPKVHEKFMQMHKDGQVLSAEIPAKTISKMINQPKQEWNGKFINWDEI